MKSSANCSSEDGEVGGGSSYSAPWSCAGTGVRDVQGSLPQAISDADRNLGIKLTVCLHFALPIKTIKRSFSPSH